MASIKTVNKTSFLFGVRFITLLQKKLGISKLEEIGEKLSSPTFEDIAIILFCAHENACFFQRKDLHIESEDYMHFFIDEIGINKAMEVLTDGMSELLSVQSDKGGGTKKKVAPK